MSSNALPTLSGDRPLLRDELARLVPALHTEGLSTHVYSDGLRTTSWLIVEKDGNVASIEYDHFGHPKVIFAIKPSRELGSGLLVDLPNGREPLTDDELVEAASIAVRDSYAGFANRGNPLPNHGWKHFATFEGRIHQLHPNSTNQEH